MDVGQLERKRFTRVRIQGGPERPDSSRAINGEAKNLPPRERRERESNKATRGKQILTATYCDRKPRENARLILCVTIITTHLLNDVMKAIFALNFTNPSRKVIFTGNDNPWGRYRNGTDSS